MTRVWSLSKCCLRVYPIAILYSAFSRTTLSFHKRESRHGCPRRLSHCDESVIRPWWSWRCIWSEVGKRSSCLLLPVLWQTGDSRNRRIAEPKENPPKLSSAWMGSMPWWENTVHVVRSCERKAHHDAVRFMDSLPLSISMQIRRGS